MFSKEFFPLFKFSLSQILHKLFRRICAINLGERFTCVCLDELCRESCNTRMLNYLLFAHTHSSVFVHVVSVHGCDKGAHLTCWCKKRALGIKFGTTYLLYASYKLIALLDSPCWDFQTFGTFHRIN